MREVLQGLDGDVFGSVSLNMNSFSDAPAVQLSLEQPLEKKAGMSPSLLKAQSCVHDSTDVSIAPHHNQYDNMGSCPVQTSDGLSK